MAEKKYFDQLSGAPESWLKYTTDECKKPDPFFEGGGGVCTGPLVFFYVCYRIGDMHEVEFLFLQQLTFLSRVSIIIECPQNGLFSRLRESHFNITNSLL